MSNTKITLPAPLHAGQTITITNNSDGDIIIYPNNARPASSQVLAGVEISWQIYEVFKDFMIQRQALGYDLSGSWPGIWGVPSYERAIDAGVVVRAPNKEFQFTPKGKRAFGLWLLQQESKK